MKVLLKPIPRLLMAGLLCFQASAVMAADCKDPKSCGQSLTTQDTTLNDKYSSLLEKAETSTYYDGKLALEPEATGGSTVTDKTTLTTRIDSVFKDKLVLDTKECSPLRWTEERIIDVPQEVVANPDEWGPTQGVAGAAGMVQPPPTPDIEWLNSGLNILSAVEVSKPVSIVLNPPAPITGARLAGALPGNLRFDYLNGQMAIYTPCRDGMPSNLAHPSTTTRFDIIVTVAGQQQTLDAVLPVSLHTSALIMELHPGDTVDRTLTFSGGPLSCAGMPVTVPCGPVGWSYQVMAGGPLPQGVTLQQSTGRLSGTVAANAYSSAGKIQLMQQGATFQTDAIFDVPVSLAPAQVISLGILRDIERGDLINIQLPQPRGGDGINYQWRVDYYSDPLPAGLSLAGNAIRGTVAPGAVIGNHRIDLVVESPPLYSSREATRFEAPMHFQLTVPFSLWTQNTFMRPPDLPAIVHDSVDTTLDIIGSVIGALICGLPCAAGGLLTADALDSELAGAIENAWDSGVQNTTADNAERMAHLIARVNSNAYDIVALQEVFQFDPGLNNGNTIAHITQLHSALGGQFDILDGPPAAGVEMNSGLKLLVRKSLASNPSYAHTPAVYQTDPILATDSSGNQHFNIDALAQKGMTLSRVQFGPDPDDYVQVVNTHMQAQAGAMYDGLRAAQQNELLNFIALHADAAHPLLIVGDMNVPEFTPVPLNAPASGNQVATSQYLSMLGNLGLGTDADLYRVSQNATNAANGYTADPSRNVYGQLWGGGTSLERLDYILLRQGSRLQVTVDSIQVTDDVLTTAQCNAWLGANPAGPLQCYLSDHYGIAAQLRLVRN